MTLVIPKAGTTRWFQPPRIQSITMTTTYKQHINQSVMTIRPKHCIESSDCIRHQIIGACTMNFQFFFTRIQPTVTTALSFRGLLFILTRSLVMFHWPYHEKQCNACYIPTWSWAFLQTQKAGMASKWNWWIQTNIQGNNTGNWRIWVVLTSKVLEHLSSIKKNTATVQKEILLQTHEGNGGV